MSRLGHTPQKRFWEKVQKTETCWLWLSTKRTNGYGSFYMSRRIFQAHRVSYDWLVGPIPKGLQLDHLCRVRTCVNPAHLEPVTQRENLLRGTGFVAMQAKQTHCKRGHELAGSNLRTNQLARGMRSCRACAADLQRLKDSLKRKSVKNSLKTHCPKGHPYSGENLQVRSNGRRRCRTCIKADRQKYWERHAR